MLSIMELLAIAYGGVSLFYLLYVLLFLVLGDKIDSHIKYFFPFAHAYLTRKDWKIITLASVAVATFIIMLGLMENAPWAVIGAIILSLWEVILSIKFYYPRKERFNALVHFGVHSTIAVYLIIIVLQ